MQRHGNRWVTMWEAGGGSFQLVCPEAITIEQSGSVGVRKPFPLVGVNPHQHSTYQTAQSTFFLASSCTSGQFLVHKFFFSLRKCPERDQEKYLSGTKAPQCVTHEKRL